MRRFLTLLAVVGLIAGLSSSAFAQINDDPTTSGTTGLFTIPRAGTVEEGRWSIGGYYQQTAREEGDSRIQQIGFSGAYGLTDRFEIYLGFEPSVKIDRRFTAEADIYTMIVAGIGGPFPTSIPNPLSGTGINEHPFATGADSSGFGDVWIGGKLKFIGDPYEYDGLAAQLGVKLPTSKSDNGIGTGAFSVEGRVVGSVEAWEAIGWNAYAGYVSHSTPDIDAKLNGIPRVGVFGGQPMIILPTQWNYFVADEFLYGVGFQLPTRATLQLIGEWTGRVTIGDMNQAYTGGTDQSLLTLGVRASMDSGLTVNAAINYQAAIKVRDAAWQSDQDAVNDAIRRWGFRFGVSYSTSRRLPLVYAGTAPREVPLLNAAPTLSCRAERTSLRQGESVRLVATTSDPDGDSVEVMWDAAAGTLSSHTGDTVTWNTTGVEPGSGLIVARANDGYGGMADCEVRVSVTVPPKPSEPTILEFMCAEFRSGSSRIDNRCKAVLDDVALQMRQNPGATAMIVGHSDSRGSDSANDEAATERAENAKAYLMDTHGIDSSRISVDGHGFSEAIGDNDTNAGRAQNRRIEIVITIPPR
jgi:outer membrane protein OmpA-like peptidoglycan-associated protein